MFNGVGVSNGVAVIDCVGISDALHLRDGRGLVLADAPPSTQLFVEEAAEDVRPLGHVSADALQHQEPAENRAWTLAVTTATTTSDQQPKHWLEVEVDDDVVEELSGVQTRHVLLGHRDAPFRRRRRVLDQPEEPEPGEEPRRL